MECDHVADACGMGLETAEANARLIAAAPDLLAACEEALEYVAEESPPHDFISAAIAKAKE